MSSTTFSGSILLFHLAVIKDTCPKDNIHIDQPESISEFYKAVLQKQAAVKVVIKDVYYTLGLVMADVKILTASPFNGFD